MTKYHIYYGWEGYLSSYPLCKVSEGINHALQRMAKHNYVVWDDDVKQNAWLAVDAVNHVKLLGIWTVGSDRHKYLECPRCGILQPYPPQHASNAVCQLCRGLLDIDRTVEAPKYRSRPEYHLKFDGRFYSLYSDSLPDAVTEAKEKISAFMGCCPLEAQGAIVSIRDNGRSVLEQIITSDGATGLICRSCGTEYPYNQLTRYCPWCENRQPVRCCLGQTLMDSWRIYWSSKNSPSMK